MPKLKEDKRMFGDESDFRHSKNMAYCKWYNNKSVLLLITNVDSMSGVSNLMGGTKRSASKTPVFCRNIIKRYNNPLGGVNIMDQKTAAYRLNYKSKYRFY